MRRAGSITLLLLASCDRAPMPAMPSPPAVASLTPSSFLKGQLHLHSNNSGDSETPPNEVVQWYADHGYDFIVFTDHNRVTDLASRPGLLVIPGMEITLNVERCDPPGPSPLCPLHVNALFIDTAQAPAAVPEPADLRRTTVYGYGIARARSLGALAQINHPNFHWAADADTIAAVASEPLLLEVANEAIDSNNDGDTTHPSTFGIWDALLTAGVRVWGTATDDAHHYGDAARVRARGELAFEGDRGWVMVRAEPGANAEQLRDAMARGDFYASNGARLDDVRCDAAGLTIWPGRRDAEVRCIAGGRAAPATSTMPGEYVCARAPDPTAYVRAEIIEPQGRRAWAQPCWSH